MPKSEKINLSIIIPCLNHVITTLKCLTYLKDFTDFKKEKAEIILVDDGSTDQTADINSRLYSDLPVKVIRHKTNLGFPKSVNDGIKIARGDLIAVFNNDMLVGPGWLEPLKWELVKHNGVEMVTGTLIEPSACKDDDFLKYVETLPKIGDFMLWHKGGPWVFKREVFDKIGLFDEGFIHTQYEDSDFLLRMALAGLKHGQVTNSYIYHYSSLTQNGELAKRVGTDYRQINRNYFIKKWGTVDISYQNAYDGKGVAQ